MQVKHKRIYFTLLFYLLLNNCSKDIYIDECSTYDYLTTIDTLKLNNKILLLGIDGFRSDAFQPNITPFIHSLSNKNTFLNLMHKTEEDTYSGPNWSSILTGVNFQKHGVDDNTFNGNFFKTYPSFFYYLERNFQNINTASIVNWDPINENLLSSDVDFFSENMSTDSLVFQFANDMLLNENPFNADVIFVHFDELDAAGHAYGFSKEIFEYRETLSTLDYYVNNLYNIIQNKRAAGENWLFILVSDHGGDGFGHGDYNNPHIRNTVLLLEHPNLSFKQDKKTNQTDIAPTILEFMGLSSSEFDCKKDGSSILK